MVCGRCHRRLASFRWATEEGPDGELLPGTIYDCSNYGRAFFRPRGRQRDGMGFKCDKCGADFLAPYDAMFSAYLAALRKRPHTVTLPL